MLITYDVICALWLYNFSLQIKLKIAVDQQKSRDLNN